MSRVEKIQKNIDKCFCPNCPSYNECTKTGNERLYCAEAVGKSKCEIKRNGCICGACPVHNECGLGAYYYCVDGSSEEIEHN